MKAIVTKPSVYLVGIFLLIGLVLIFRFPTPVFADCFDAFGTVVPCGTPGAGGTPPASSAGGNTPAPSAGGNTPSPSGGGNAQPTQGSARIDNPLNVGSISQFIEKLLKALIQIGIPIAVLFVIYSGFKFILAQGRPDELAIARRNFLYTVIGIAIFIGAWALAQLVVATLRSAGIIV